MISGPGFTDAEGVYHLGEADNPDGTFSGLMQPVTEAISDQFGLVRTDIADLGTPGMRLLGTETFTAVSAVNLTSDLVAGFRRFRVMGRWVQSASASTRLRLRDGVTDHTTGYDFQLLQGAASTASAVRGSNQPSWELCGILSASSVIEIDLLVSHPLEAVKTLFKVATLGVDGNDPFEINYGGSHRTADDYDGLSIYPSSGTITGELSLYGFAR